MTLREHKVEIVVSKVIRRHGTTRGNPMWEVYAEDGRVWRNEPDSACAYDISASIVGKRVELSLNGRADIYRVNRKD